MNKFSILLMTLPLVGVIGIGKVQAQITSADTVTKVEDISNGNGTTSTITGGNTSSDGDGTNQFHSLTQFNLGTDDVANFQAANGNITNILTRVTGGDISKINGTIQVTGGNNPNLFLMNPAGFIFGKDAKTFNLPGSLTVTTANGIGFGSGSNTNFFSATGSNDYSKLTENPTAFAFTMDNPGAIVNSGDLSVKEGQNLTLVGGTVVNTGTLTAEKGQITIAAVPGKSTVRISQQGNLLSLDIASTTETTGNPNPLPSRFKIESLPNLLAGGNISNVTGITVNEDNTVTLTGSGINIKDGDVVSYNSDGSKNSILPDDRLETSKSPNVSIISKNGNIKTDRIISREKVFLSAEKGNIEVDTIFAGILDGEADLDEFRAGDINIKAGGFFRAIGREEVSEDIRDSDNTDTPKIFASITVANPISNPPGEGKDPEIDKTTLPFIRIKTKNDVITQNEPGDGIGEVKIEVGSEFFVVGDSTKEPVSFKDNESGTIGVIAARTNGNQSGVKSIDGRTFGNPDPPPRIINPPSSEKPGDSNTGGTNTGGTNIGNSNTGGTNTGDSNTGNSNTSDSNTGNSNTGDSNTRNSNTADSNTGDSDTGNQEQQQQDRDQDRDRDQNQEQEEITVFGVLSLDESLVALLKDKGHATELTLSNDGNGELTGSDFNLFNTDDEEELKTFNFDRDLLYKNYVFSRK
ncbi:two-partner secretion domain-containing protein [Mastigocoleus testarum]|nr:filamentous hemagglutinin N-terminal domain-containing protein [Mastigocoleus testarum]